MLLSLQLYTLKNVEGICVKRIGFVLMAILAIAFIMPAGMAQSMQTVNINGYVYSGALPMDGAKVQIYSWDGKNMGNAPLKTVTTSDGSSGIKGSFLFKNVPYDSSKSFNYVVKAEKDDKTAYSLVYVVPPEKAGETPKVEAIFMDLSMDSWMTDLTGTVHSGNLLANAIGVPNANVTIYERNQTSGELLPAKVTTVTDPLGKLHVKDLPYGMYQVEVKALVNNKNYLEKVNFSVYQQETNINVIMSGITYATPTPTPIPGPSGKGGSGLPGFEAILALAALTGTAIFLRKR